MESLNSSIQAYRGAIKQHRFRDMLEFIHPSALEAAGGKKAIIRAMDAFAADAAENPDKEAALSRRELHHEMQPVLQIFLREASIQPGEFVHTSFQYWDRVPG